MAPCLPFGAANPDQCGVMASLDNRLQPTVYIDAVPELARERATRLDMPAAAPPQADVIAINLAHAA